MLSTKEIIYEIKEMISEEDVMMFNDFDDFIKTNMDNYLSMKIRGRKYMEHIIKPFAVSDYQVALPKYYEIIQVAGSDNNEVRINPYGGIFLNTEVAGYMMKDSQDNVYTVYKKKGPCADNCDTELIMNANIFADEIHRGTNYRVIKETYYDYEMDKERYCRSKLDRRYFLMRPSESSWHGIKGEFIEDCINFSTMTKGKYKYDFSILNSRKGKILKTNFKEGIVLLSYYGRIYDEDDYLMLPEDCPKLLESVSYFVQMKIFRKLANQFKTSDYNNRERVANENFMMYDREASSELNHYTYHELAPIIARAKFKNHIPKTYEEILNRDGVDDFQQSIDNLHDY